jgi:NADPH:quinone reductase-like Zn-dependent oxidoreductase
VKAIVVNSFGGPAELEPVELPKPAAAPGQVLVAVESAGVGLADALLRQGFLPGVEPGFTPGLELAGTVVEVGEGVDAAWLHSRVFAMVAEGNKSGCYAEFVATDVGRLVPIPPTVSPTAAVALGINALVAEFVIRRAQLKPGEQVIVRGAGGGIGVLLVQLAAQRGAVVTASTSSIERAERLLELGAAHAVDRAGKPLTGGAPETYDVVLDTVAGPDLLTFSDKLNDNGRVVLAGIAGGMPPAEVATALVDPRSLSFSLLSLDAVTQAAKQAALRELFAAAARGELTPIVHEVLPLERASDAHHLLEAGKVFGKIVLETSR